MIRAFVAIGSNIEPAVNVLKAVCLLNLQLQVGGISTVYMTEAMGKPAQKHFYNCVAEIRTDLEPWDLKFQVLRCIESQLGRERTADLYADRTIDLDLVLYDELVLKTEELLLPDPDIFSRFFIAAPLAELAPDLILPGSNVPIAQVASTLSANGAQPLHSYTRQLRNSIQGL